MTDNRIEDLSAEVLSDGRVFVYYTLVPPSMVADSEGKVWPSFASSCEASRTFETRDEFDEWILSNKLKITRLLGPLVPALRGANMPIKSFNQLNSDELRRLTEAEFLSRYPEEYRERNEREIREQEICQNNLSRAPVYEYMHVDTFFNDLEEVNELAKQGWRVITSQMEIESSIDGTHVYFILERKVK